MGKGQEKPDVLIVGAGVCGLALADMLCRRGVKVAIVERETVPGGLARSFAYGDSVFDVGPHRFHTDNPDVSAFIREVLGDRAIEITRRSGVFFLGRYHDWPLGPSTLFKLPPTVMARVAYDLAFKLYKVTGPRTFENHILNMYGPTLYKIFFLEYTEKFLRIPASTTHADWAKTGIDRAIIDRKLRMNSLAQVVITTMLPKPPPPKFLYPRGGLRVFDEALVRRVSERGCAVRLGAPVDSLTCEGGRISTLTAGGRTYAPGRVVWTGSLRDLCARVAMPAPALDYLGLVLFNVVLRRPSPTPYQWCYFGSRDIVFNRTSAPTRFDPLLAPAGKDGLCVEITCRQGDDTWNRPEALRDAVLRDLLRVGLIESEEDVEAMHPERMLESYPVYNLAYREELDRVKSDLSALGNLTLAGRTGLFWYNNMDNSIENAMEVARQIAPS